MRIVRYLSPDDAPQADDARLASERARYGVLGADGVVSTALGDPFKDGFRATGEPAEVGLLLSPVKPAAVLCIGRNYAAHAAEGGSPPPERPVVFMKTPAAVQRPGGPIVLPRRLRSERVDYEAELVVVIGKPCKNVSRSEALDYVLGYTCGNDVSARDWQKGGGGGQWCRGKTFDTFAPIGPAIVTADEVPDPQDLRVTTRIRDPQGEQRLLQDARTSEMLFDVATLIEFLSASGTLEPGAVIFTGTPEGVGFAQKPPRFLDAGDEVTVEIEGLGRLSNPVVEEDAQTLERWSLA